MSNKTNDQNAQAPAGSLARPGSVLRLHLTKFYWDQIRRGIKTHEYRLASKWLRRLHGKTYSEIHLLCGYPRVGDESKLLRRKWNGYTIEFINHPHFGGGLVRVLAIDVRESPNPQAQQPGSDTPATDAMQAKFRPDQPQAYEAWEYARRLERAGNSLSNALEEMASHIPTPESHAQLTKLQRQFYPALKALNAWAKACPNPKVRHAGPDVNE